MFVWEQTLRRSGIKLQAAAAGIEQLGQQLSPRGEETSHKERHSSVRPFSRMLERRFPPRLSMLIVVICRLAIGIDDD